MISRSFPALLAVAAISLASTAGCATSNDSSDGTDGTAQDVISSGVATVPVDASSPLENPSMQALRSLYLATTYDYQSIHDSSAFNFFAEPAMNDAVALGIAKSVAAQKHYAEVHQYVLNAAGTPKRLGHLANTLAQNLAASGDGVNTPKLVTAMVKAFSLPNATPGGQIKVFSAVGPGDDHDFDNVDREVIFVDIAHGEVLILQGQAIDM